VFLGTVFAWHIATTIATTSRSPHGAVSGPMPS